MRLSIRLRLSALAVLASCLLLLMAFVGTASAFTVNPHITATPHHVVTDAFGCAPISLSGKGFTESTATVTNFADEHLFNSTGGTVFFAQTGNNSIMIPVSAAGTFKIRTVICQTMGVFPGDTFVISGFDDFTGLANNSVTIRAD